MKKNLLLLSLLISSVSFAQTTTSFGFKAGLSNSTIKGETATQLNDLIDKSGGMVSTQNRNGFFAGAYASIPLDETISIQPGINYVQKGYTLNGDLNIKGIGFLGANAKAQLQTDYIEIPLLVKVNLDKFEVFAGPQVGYLMNANLKTTAGILGINLLNKKFDVSNQFNKWDAGLNFGLGYKITDNFDVSAAYDFGLSKVDANKSFSAFNRGVKVGLGISF